MKKIIEKMKRVNQLDVFAHIFGALAIVCLIASVFNFLHIFGFAACIILAEVCLMENEK